MIQRKIRIYGFSGIVICFFLFSGSLYAEKPYTLFEEPVNAKIDLGSVDTSIVIRQRPVYTRFDLLRGEDVDILYLNLFDDVYLTAILDYTEEGTSDGFAWIGYLAEVENSKVTLVVNDHKLSGTIALPDMLYQVRHVEGSLHVVREIDPLAFLDTLHYSLSQDLLVDEPTEDFRPNALSSEEQINALSSEEQIVLELVNQERSIRGLHRLNSDDRLATAARGHSQDMAQNDYFSHTGRDGRSAGQRIQDAGYSWNTWGENIAAGYSSPQAVMNAWMNSSGHRANILRASFCDIGVGYATGGSYGHYWTQNFARERDIRSCPE